MTKHKLAKRLVVAIVVVVMATVTWMWFHPTTTKTYTPIPVGVAQLTVAVPITNDQANSAVCSQKPKACADTKSKNYTLSSHASGQCWSVQGKSVVGNDLVADVMDGTGTFSACANANWTEVTSASFFTNHHESWGWSFDGVDVLDNRTVYDASNYAEKHIWSLQFRWHTGITVFGQSATPHITTTLNCTFYANQYNAWKIGHWSCS